MYIIIIVHAHTCTITIIKFTKLSLSWFTILWHIVCCKCNPENIVGERLMNLKRMYIIIMYHAYIGTGLAHASSSLYEHYIIVQCTLSSSCACIYCIMYIIIMYMHILYNVHHHHVHAYIVQCIHHHHVHAYIVQCTSSSSCTCIYCTMYIIIMYTHTLYNNVHHHHHVHLVLYNVHHAFKSCMYDIQFQINPSFGTESNRYLWSRWNDHNIAHIIAILNLELSICIFLKSFHLSTWEN